MTITTSAKDFMNMKPCYMFVNFISADNDISDGTAITFEKVYGMQNKLNKIWSNSDKVYDGDNPLNLGESYLIDNVYNLTVKIHSCDKMDFNAMYAALVDTRNQMEYSLQNKLVVPFLDYINVDSKDDWYHINQIIAEIFKDTDVEIVLC